eukprot:6569368-Ditylum_brightwellii.AAC.1
MSSLNGKNTSNTKGEAVGFHKGFRPLEGGNQQKGIAISTQLCTYLGILCPTSSKCKCEPAGKPEHKLFQ